MSSRMKYGSLSRSFGKLVSSTLKQQQQQQPLESASSSMSTASLYGTLPRKSGKKRKSDELTPELTNGLRKLSGSRAIPAELVEWVNTIELREKDIAERSQSKLLLREKSREKMVEKDQGAPVVAGGDADPITSAASSFPRRRGSIKPRIALSEAEAAAGKSVKSGQLYVRVIEMKHKHKTLREDKMFVVVVSVQKCSLATVPVPYSQAVSFEEGFVFEITGEFDIKVEVFLQSKEKSPDNKYEIPESLGVLNFTGLTTLALEMLTGSYILTKEGVETTTSVTLQLAIKLNEEEEPNRELLPKPDHSGCLSYQVPHGVTYNWNMDECELRGRSLRFYHDNKKFMVIRIDPNTVAKKADTYSSEISLPYNCFQVIVCGKPVYLLAQTRPEMKEWIEKINKAIQADVF